MNKWGSRVIRLTALALIAFPEPVTTGIGIATLVGSSLLKRRHEDEVLKRFELVLREHLIQTRHLEYVMSTNNRLDRISRHYQFSLNNRLLSSNYVYDNNFESRTPEKLIYHSEYTPLLVHKNIKSLPQPYSYGSLKKHSIRPNELVLSEKLIHHKLDIKQLSRSYRLGEYSRSMNQKRKTTQTSIYNSPPELPRFTTITGFKRNT
jgi:hypothetical protein